MIFGSPQLDRVDEPVARVADRDDLRDRHAALAGRAVGGADGGVGGHVDVGVGEHDHVVLRPAERLHALAVLRAGLVDIARDRRRADEADRGDVRVLEDRVDRDLVALHDVEDAVRDARLLEQLCSPERPRTGPSRTAGTNVFPHASAGAHIHMGTIAGKLNGA